MSLAMATFNERLRNVVGPRGYEGGLRRSIQSVVLFEAKRILAQMEAQRTAENLAALRAFQRKHVHWEVAKAVLETTDLQSHERNEVLWRTGTSKEPLGAETAWKRCKIIEKELQNLADAIHPFQAPGRSDEEAIDLYVQSAFVSCYNHVVDDGKGYSFSHSLSEIDFL